MKKQETETLCPLSFFTSPHSAKKEMKAHAAMALPALLAMAVAAPPSHTQPTAPPSHTQPTLTLQFATEIHAGQGYGHDGDGCLLAQAAMADAPVVQRVWFDKPGRRLALTNPGMARPNPDPNLTVVLRFDEAPPTELDLDVRTYGPICDAEPLPPAFCKNGSQTCPPTFGDFGFGNLNALTSVLGSNYYATSFLEALPEQGAEVWQWEWVKPTRINVNGSLITYNITRNYTYTIADAAHAAADGSRPVRSFYWTQSIPLRPVLPVHRDCFLFDYRTRYTPGPIDPARWEPAPGVACQNRTSSSSSSSSSSSRRYAAAPSTPSTTGASLR